MRRMQKREQKINMFWPLVTKRQYEAITKKWKDLYEGTDRWIGQGPAVDEFERQFSEKFGIPFSVGVNSGSAALETACDLLALSVGDLVIVSPLTCTATNIPLARRGCKLLWADLDPNTLNISQKSVDKLLKDNHGVRAIFNVHLGGIRSDIDGRGVPVVDDAAQALGIYRPEALYTIYSFQGIKTISTGDGGMFCTRSAEDARKAKLLRWFGIDREKKRDNNWEAYDKNREMVFDIELLGHKRQPTDLDAIVGIAGLEDYAESFKYRADLFWEYIQGLKDVQSVKVINGAQNVYWLCTILSDNREKLVKLLNDYNIECSTVQNRNDVYAVFGGKRQDLPVMNEIESQYLSLPLHNHMTIEDVRYICDVIKLGESDGIK